MPDSQDHPRPHDTEAIFRSSDPVNNNQPSFDRKLEMSRGLIDLELEATKPAGKRMSIRERTVRLCLEVLLTLVFICLEVAMFIVNPALFTLSLSITGATVVAILRKKQQDPQEREDEGDP